jgi:putative cardiolipin synthase
VRVLTNSLASTDVPAAYAGYQRYRRALLEAGVELHEFKAKPPLEAIGQDAAGDQAKRTRPSLSGSSRASLHAKTLVFDRNTLFISSMNMDPRSVFTNTEIGVLVSHPGLAAAQVERLDSRLAEISYRLELVPAAGGEGATDIVWVTTQDGRTTRYTSPPKATVWQRFKVWFYSLLPIEHLL